MIVENRNNNRREPFLRIEFKDDDEYQRFINTLKEACQLLYQSPGSETYIVQEEPIIETIERFKRYNDDGTISSVIWQDKMLSLFCLFYDMVHLVVELNKAYTLSCDLIELYKETESKYETIISFNEETIKHQETIINYQNKLIKGLNILSV